MKPKNWQDMLKTPPRVDFEVKGLTDTDEGTRLLLRASAPVKDRDGETIDPMGWRWNETRKPNLLACHDSWTLESWVGKALELRKDETGLYYEGLLFDKAPVTTAEGARFIAWMAREHLDAISCSVGFKPLKWQDPEGRSYTIDAPGNSFPWSVPGRKYIEQELLELSIVPVPSLIEALALQVRTFGGLLKPEGERPAAPDPMAQILDIAKSAGIPLEIVEHDPAWLKAGVKHPVSRPLIKVGAHLSGADVERLSQARGLIDEILAMASPAE